MVGVPSRAFRQAQCGTSGTEESRLGSSVVLSHGCVAPNWWLRLSKPHYAIHKQRLIHW